MTRKVELHILPRWARLFLALGLILIAFCVGFLWAANYCATLDQTRYQDEIDRLESINALERTSHEYFQRLTCQRYEEFCKNMYRLPTCEPSSIEYLICLDVLQNTALHD